jgi:CxxC-x17-CxxC domain-containing protein
MLTEPPSTPWESAMSYADKTLNCRDCGQAFVFTGGEQEFFAQKGFTNAPSRCPTCRASRRGGQGSGSGGHGGSYSGGGYNADPYSSGRGGAGYGAGGYGRQERELFSATCSTCGNEARVPFQPRGDRPVYCSDCFTQARGSSGGGYGGRRDDRY